MDCAWLTLYSSIDSGSYYLCSKAFTMYNLQSAIYNRISRGGRYAGSDDGLPVDADAHPGARAAAVPAEGDCHQGRWRNAPLYLRRYVRAGRPAGECTGSAGCERRRASGDVCLELLPTFGGLLRRAVRGPRAAYAEHPPVSRPGR